MYDDIEHFLLPALEHKSKKRKSLFGFLSIGRYENHIVIGKYKILKNYDRHIATTDLSSEKKIQHAGTKRNKIPCDYIR